MGKLSPGELGFLLLTSHLGDPNRKPLTVAQCRELFLRAKGMDRRNESRDMEVRDFVALGYSSKAAAHIVGLLKEEALLQYYLEKARKSACVPITRATQQYPVLLRKRLGLDSPGCLWTKGEIDLLNTPMVSLVGSRDLAEANEAFAAEVGRQAALQGYTLVSGNARGADKTAQKACLAAGGSVICIVADSLESHTAQDRMLYVSESSFDEGFSAQRALSRNRVIHGLGLKTFVAQASLGIGGTWDGTEKNLRFGWSDVYCYQDGTAAMQQLEAMGATLIDVKDLVSFYDLPSREENFLDR